jgi:hypothetical protein
VAAPQHCAAASVAIHASGLFLVREKGQAIDFAPARSNATGAFSFLRF